jgi:hypothetical protein
MTNCNHSMEKISVARYEASSRLLELQCSLHLMLGVGNSRSKDLVTCVP